MTDQNLQQECRRRAAKKLAATLSFPDFRFPTRLSAEQATGDDLAKLHAEMIPTGAKVADLTCGLGIDTFYLARRASEVTAIELDPIVSGAIAPNAAALGLDNVQVVNADCVEWLKQCPPRSFDVCFIDPARRGDSGQRLYSLHDCRPDIVEILPLIQKVAPRVIVKMSPMLDIEAVLRELPETRRLYVMGTSTECKELVADVVAGFSGEAEIIVKTTGHTDFKFHRSQLSKAELFCEELKPGDRIGEPWHTIMKAAPRAALSGTKLHPDTHLWLNPDDDFPGRIYTIEAIEDFSSGNIKRLSRQKLEASVAVKNLPITAAELSKRLKVRESSTRRLVGATIASGRRFLLFLKPAGSA